jgi:uncharacterized membrane protein YgcG
MRRFLLALLAGLALSAPAQARLFTQPELDALVAPIALYPDGLISDILVASTYPDQVEAAARLPKDAPADESWNPSVQQLVSFPDILQRMVESPQWTRDLGEAFLAQEPHVLDTVQALRRRAQQQGTLKSNEQVTVEQEGAAIVVQPRTEVVYAPYYDPYVVYGPWWWPAYHPVYWRPWVVAPVAVGFGFFYARPVWHHRHVVVPTKFGHTVGYRQAPVHVHHTAVRSRDYYRVPESQRRPIISSSPQVHRFDEHRARGSNDRRWSGGEQRQRQSRPESRQQHAPAPRTSMPAAPRFSEQRPHPQVRAAQPQQRAAAPQQRAAAPQPRASMPQQSRAPAPQQPRFGATVGGGGGGRGGEMRGGGGQRFGGGGQRGNGGRG